MPTYSVQSSSLGSTKSSPNVLNVAGGPPTCMTSHRLYGRDTTANILAGDPACSTSRHGSALNNGIYNTPNLNSRSPISTSFYINNDAETNAQVAPVLFSLNSIVTHNSILFGTRYFPVVIDTEQLFGGVSANSGSTGLIDHWGFFSEAFVVPSRRTRRPTRGGYFPTMGNSIGLFATIIFPSFDTDVYWTSPPSWKLGHHQSDVWNINLFGGSRPASHPAKLR